jgi:hypothetical protein
MLKIMEVENDKVEEYTCAMPRYYAVPLILMNKRLAFFEASCHPDGTPILPPPPPTTTTDNDDGGRGLRERDLREYSYLWHLRTQFLQAVFDMNHERRLDERWRYVKIHGFVYRLYRRYGHEDNQRILYWRNEIKAGRVPYGTPDIADMGMSLSFHISRCFFSSASSATFRTPHPFFYSRLPFFFLFIPPSTRRP